ncbi:MAG: histidine--tRNA ligase [Flavobacteriales bacterium]|nr:histidine--tRNA ligase [Flavobacteriales bacterium]
MMSKPSIPKGTRDFGPAEMIRRNYIFSTIRKAFETFGFMPIETPAMENLSTLTGKYGEEGDQLIFKILNNGDFLAKADAQAMQEGDSKKLAFSISKKALRYDLTVPFARFVVMNQTELTFPFRRYQIQPVWRGDRPGKGRYQEFYQCDADIVGTEGLTCEVELVQLFDEVLTNLQIPGFEIRINNRKILLALAQVAGIEDRLVDLTVAMDKLDKIGENGVVDELQKRGIPEGAIEKIRPLFSLNGDFQTKHNVLSAIFEGNEAGQKGLEELRYVFDAIRQMELRSGKLEFDVTLARGLNYYTGAIFEVVVPGVQIGSICGGGRYDDLTGIFGLPNVSGVGISFGADRIYDVLHELNLFPNASATVSQLLFVNFGEAEERYCLNLATRLRRQGVACELYPTSAKMKKQMTYANNLGFPYVALVGSREMETGIITIKKMETGEQYAVDKSEILEFLTA